MPKNESGISLRQAEVLEGRTKGKSQRDIAKELGVSQPTVSRDWKELNKDESIKELVQELKAKNLRNAIKATEVEDKFVSAVDDKEKEKITPQEASTITSIKTSSQNIYSKMQGDVTDDKGGERRSLKDLTEEELRKLVS